MDHFCIFSPCVKMKESLSIGDKETLIHIAETSESVCVNRGIREDACRSRS